MGREAPVPSTASITRSVAASFSASNSPPGSVVASSVDTPAVSASSCFGSGVFRPVHRTTVTAAPALARCLPATKPSAPLFPGPIRITIRLPKGLPPRSGSRQLPRTYSATANPAFSMRSSSDTPASTEACSIELICAAVTSFMASTRRPWPRPRPMPPPFRANARG